jgi:hypothetical protein
MDISTVGEVLPATGFWASQLALYMIGLAAALAVLLWDWRISLPGLLVTQFGLGQVLVFRYGLPGEWSAVYFLVMMGAVLIMALTPIQLGLLQPLDRAGNLFFRGLLIALLGLVVYSLPINISLPVVDVATVRLMLWLVVCALLFLGLSDESIYSGAGLLLWLIPFQSYLAILLPLPSLIALIGALGLLIALGCSYLALLEDERVQALNLPITDVTFPAVDAARSGAKGRASHLLPTLAPLQPERTGDQTGENPLQERQGAS